jgi:hypothetical protein
MRGVLSAALTGCAHSQTSADLSRAAPPVTGSAHASNPAGLPLGVAPNVAAPAKRR